MAGRIPDSFVNDLIERTDIVAVIGARVQLRKTGSNYKGLCPFHDEKTPSFSVSPDKQFYYCFGCGASGTALGFLMQHDGLGFVEAVETLASLAGVDVPREQGSARPKVDNELYDALSAADDRYRNWLRNSPDAERAVAYLKDRGLTGAVARDFGIGLAPAGWDGVKKALASYGEDRLVAAGLVVRNDAGRTYDRFRERIMFPIRDTRGRVVGFGGRVFGDGEPKYLNSPETEVFHKGRELYGLFEARRAVKRNLASVVVVEGYMDVVALAQHGIDNAVATLGTAIGTAHFEKLFRLVDQVVCCFDGDDAGRGAAWKAVDAAFPSLSEGRQLRFVFLPEGEDPDTAVRRHGADHFTALVDQAVPAGAYFLDHLRAGLDLDRVDAQATLVDLAMPHLARLPQGALRLMLVAELAKLGRTQPEVVERRLQDQGGYTPQPRAASAAEQSHGSAPRASKLGERLLHVLIKHPQLLEGLAADTRTRLGDAGGAFGDVVRYLAAEPNADTATLLGRFVGEPCYAELAELAERPALLSAAQLADEFAAGVPRYLAELARAADLALFQQLREDDSADHLQRYWDAKQGRLRSDA